MRRGLSLAEYLIHQCSGPTGDRRLVVALGRDAFSAALCVLLQQEAWSEGMEWEIVDFLTLLYGTLVLGETRSPDGAIIPHATTTTSSSGGGAGGDKYMTGGGKTSGGGRTGGMKQSNNNNTNNNNNGGQKGFGSMTSWQGGGGGNGGKGNNRNNGSSTSVMGASNGAGDGSSGDGGSICIYSDLPRQVLLMLPQTTSHSTTSVVTSIAPLVEHFERQLSTQLSKKKRREHLKDFLKAAATGTENNGNAGVGPSAKGTRSVLDIRKRMTVG